MLRRTLVLATATAALAAGTAHAGGWATVNVQSAPKGVEAGQAWTLKVTMLQHGRSPWTGEAPVANFSNGAEDLTFPTAPTAEPGVYTTRVVLPQAGTWKGTLADVFDRARPLAPVKVAARGKGAPAAAVAPPASGDSGGGTGVAIAVGGGIALAIALAAGIALARTPRPRPTA